MVAPCAACLEWVFMFCGVLSWDVLTQWWMMPFFLGLPLSLLDLHWDFKPVPKHNPSFNSYSTSSKVVLRGRTTIKSRGVRPRWSGHMGQYITSLAPKTLTKSPVAHSHCWLHPYAEIFGILCIGSHAVVV